MAAEPELIRGKWQRLCRWCESRDPPSLAEMSAMLEDIKGVDVYTRPTSTCISVPTTCDSGNSYVDVLK
jgi:hypothetical protein